MGMLDGPGLKPTVTLEDLIIELPFLGKGGIRSADLVCHVLPEVFNNAAHSNVL